MKNSKYFTLFFFFLGFIAFHAYSQTDFTLEQLKAFNRQKLTLELEEISMERYSEDEVTYSTWKKWKAYQGFAPISESEFYRIAGYENLAVNSEIREKKGKIFKWSGIGLGVGGSIIVVSALIENDLNLLLAGVPTTIAGAVLMSRGISINATNLTPYSSAYSIADEFNWGLTITIKKNF